MADRIGVINKGKIILVDDKNTLMQKLGKKQLKLHLQSSLSELPAGLEEFNLELTNDGIELIYTFDSQSKDTGIVILLRKLNEHGVYFKDLQSSESSLEDIFVNLVRNQS
jgi:ABC-2 type transport system ATP-binding protein